jgi:hypothetical protein
MKAMSSEESKEMRTWTEEIEVLGSELAGRLKELVAEGNVRRLILRTHDGHVLIELPLTAGVAVGGVVTIMAPVLAAVGALAALIAHAKVEVVRTGEPNTPGTAFPDNPKNDDQPSRIAAGGQDRP